MISHVQSLIRPALGAAALVPVVAILAACGSPSSATPSISAAASPSGSSAAAAPTYPQLTYAQLVKALPSLSDVPVGYTAEKPESKDSDVTACNFQPPNKETGYASITFDGTGGSDIAATIRQYGSATDASAQMAALVHATQAGCSMKTSGTTVRVAQMSAPKLGDSSTGFAISGQGFVIDDVDVQVGPAIIQIGQGGMAAANVAQATSVAKKAIADYQRVAKG